MCNKATHLPRLYGQCEQENFNCSIPYITRMYNEHPRLLYYWSLWSINPQREVSTETQGQEVSWNTEDNAWTRWPVLYHVYCAQLTWAFEGDEWSALYPDYFSPGEKAPGTHWTEDWAGPTANMDVSEIRKTSCSNQKLNYDFLVLSVSQATNWSISIDKSTTFNYLTLSYVTVCQGNYVISLQWYVMVLHLLNIRVTAATLSSSSNAPILKRQHMSIMNDISWPVP